MKVTVKKEYAVFFLIGFSVFSIFTLINKVGGGLQEWMIDGNAVYVDDANVYIRAEPHTLSRSGIVTFNLTSKVYEGNIDLMWGFDTDYAKPTKAELYHPYTTNTTKSFTCTGDYFNYTYVAKSHPDNHYWCWVDTSDTVADANGTVSKYTLANDGWFEWGDIPAKTAYWNVINQHDYKDVSDRFSSISYDYGGINKWYYVTDIPIQSNKNYQIRASVNVAPRLGSNSGKYWVCVKPSGESISQAVTNGHLYCLDPWWDTSYGYRSRIDTNSTTSTDIINITLGGHNYWIRNATSIEDVYVYCENSGCGTGDISFGNDTDEKPWLNETDGTGYDTTNIADANLLAWYTLNNVTGMDVTDMSHNLTVTGAPNVTESAFGRGWWLNSSDSNCGNITNADSSDLLEGKGAGTVCGWLWTNSTGGAAVAQSSGTFIVRETTLDRLNMFAYTADADTELKTDNDEMRRDVFQFVCLVYDGSDMWMYKNGTIVMTSAAPGGNFDAGGQPLGIGNDGGGIDIVNGSIDDVRIYDRALTQLEIQAQWEQYNTVGGESNFTHLNTEESAPAPGPQFTNERKKYPTGTIWDISKVYGFQIDITATSGFFNTTNVTFEANFTGAVVNYTNATTTALRNNTDVTFLINFTQEQFDGANDFQYRWFAANASNAENVTSLYYYTITGADPSTLMSVTGTSPIVHLTASDFEGTETNTNDVGCVYVLERNDTATSNPDNTVLAAVDYNYTYYTDGCTNYTRGQVESSVIVLKSDGILYLWLNDTHGNISAINGTAVNISITSNSTTQWTNMTVNYTGWVPQQGTPNIENVTKFNFTSVPSILNVTAYQPGQNYTNNTLTYWLTLDDVAVDSESYSVNITESDDTTISVTFSYPSGAEDLKGTLIWNHEAYANDSVTMTSSLITLRRTFTMSALANNSQWIPFFWNYTYAGESRQNATSPVHSQTIYKPQIGLCANVSDVPSITLLLMNETDDFGAINATMDVFLTFTIDSTEYTFNTSTMNETLHLCIYPDYGNFTVDGHVQYSNESYRTRDYYFDDVIFDNTTDIINMTMLDTTQAPKIIEITVKDQYGTLYEGVIVKPQRWYPGLNLYMTSLAGITDANGQLTTYLALNTVYYRFLLEKDGGQLALIPAMVITDTGATYLELTLIISPEEIIDWIRYWDRITGSCEYTNSTGNLTCRYNDNSDTLESVQFTVTEYAGALSSEVICSATNTTVPAGSFICHIGNESAYTNRYVYQMMGTLDTGEHDEYLIVKGVIDFREAITRLFGNCSNASNLAKCREGAVIAFIVTLLAAFIGVYNPAIGIMMSLAGLGVTVVVGLWAISMQFIIGLVFVAAVIIYYMRS